MFSCGWPISEPRGQRPGKRSGKSWQTGRRAATCSYLDRTWLLTASTLGSSGYLQKTWTRSSQSEFSQGWWLRPRGPAPTRGATGRWWLLREGGSLLWGCGSCYVARASWVSHTTTYMSAALNELRELLAKIRRERKISEGLYGRLERRSGG